MKTFLEYLYSVVVTTVICITLLLSCKEKKTSATMASSPPKISVATPLVKDIVLTKEYPGYLQSNSTIDIVARVNGYLIKQNYKPGQMVNKGDVLFVIEPELYLNAVQQAEAQLNSATATLEYAKNNYERMLEASQSDAISQIELIQANTKVSTSEAAVTNAKAALQTAEKNLEYCYIKAPVSGYVSVNNIDVGNYVSGSVQPVKLATLYNNNPIYVYFNIEDNQYLNMAVLSRIKKGTSLLGDSINIRMMNELMPTIRASVDYLSPNVTLTTGTLNLRAVIKDNKWGLRSGMYCTIELPYSEEQNAILINDASTGTDQLGRYIYVVNDDNTVEYRHIEVGQIINDSLIQVTSGLSKGERYVTKALLKVRNGIKIEPIK